MKRQELQNRIALSEERLQHFQSESTEFSKRVKQVEDEISSLRKEYETKQKEQESTLSKLRSDNEEIGEALRILQDAYSTLQGEVNYFDNRKKVLETDFSDWQERAKREAVRLEECLVRVGNGEKRIAEIEARPEALQAEKESWLREISEREAKAKEASEALTVLENELNELEREKQGAGAELKRLQDLHDSCASDLAGCKEALLVIEVRISDDFLLSPKELLSHFEEADLLNNDIGKLRLSVERMKGRREALGTVNLQAESESEVLSAEIAETESERDDLEEAVKKLRLAIARLNAKAREQLEESFTKVDNNFSALFGRLFGGGTAALRWVGDDDILLAGLEITVTPPGKKTQLLSLLSGGEQTLTALALLFAVFVSRPALICVLDEVDALLDDNNVSRFCDLLVYLKDEVNVQFLVVSHHRLTMSRADRLYGVTMAERGVSSLVSVDMETAENYRETPE